MPALTPPLSIQSVPTRIFRHAEDLADFVVEHVPPAALEEKLVLAVTTKIVSLAENRVVPKHTIEKRKLIEQEADIDLGPIAYGSILTVKEGLFIASAGIDESNSASGDYILYPVSPIASAQKLCMSLRNRWRLRELGVLLTDSRTTPLRQGVTGVSIAHWGFSGLQNKVGQRDLFGRPLQMTKVNAVDALAAAATLVMGEANESCPLALIRGASVDFSDKTDAHQLRIDIDDDLYYPFFAPRMPTARNKTRE